MAVMDGQRKTIFITGAGSGIGRATAHLFAERGWFVGLFDLNEAGLRETAQPVAPDQHMLATFDVRDRAGWAGAVEAFGKATNGRMHVLFNNAGVGRGGPIDEMPAADIDLVIDVNLKGVLNGAVAALPLLKQTPGARIVNTCSVAGFIGVPGMSVYVATKFAVRGLTESLDAELASAGVSVASLAPWFVDTAILDARPDQQTNRALRDVLTERRTPIYPVRMAAERAWDAAHGRELHYMVGREAERARFAARFFPWLIRAQVKRQLDDA